MIRYVGAFCSLILSVAPTLSHSGIAIHFERPEAHRHAINAVLGDASYVARFGSLPPPGTDPDVRVRTHLQFVHAILSARDPATQTPDLRQARRRNLDRLQRYIDGGVFPRNDSYPTENRPTFIDREGWICAVGYLIEQSAGRELAERINAEYHSEFLWRMCLPELDRWVAGSGLSLQELSMIQPAYAPRFDVTVRMVTDMTVQIRGYVWDPSVNPCITRVSFYVGSYSLATHMATWGRVKAMYR
jgi:hypothetical protein